MSRTVVVNGMHEAEGARRLEEELAELEGVDAVEADHEADVIDVEGDVDDRRLARGIREAGYETPI